MNRGLKMLAVTSARNNGRRSESGGNRSMGYDQRNGMDNRMENRYENGMENRYENRTENRGGGRRSEYEANGYARNEYNGSGMNYGGVEGRFRDRRGREHYDNGRYAPMRNEWEDDMDMRRSQAMRGEGGDRSMNQIGFQAGAEMGGEYRMSAGYDQLDELEHRKGGAKMSGYSMGQDVAPFDKETAMEWTSQMKNEDGTTGPHWTMEQTKQVMAQKGVKCDPYEFFAAMNAMYSDYSKVFKKHGVGEKLDFYVDMAKAFLDDKDAQPDKMSRYFTYVVKH